MLNRALKCDTASKCRIRLVARGSGSKEAPVGPAELLWFRTRLGVGLYCHRSRLRDLFQLYHFRFLCRLSYLDFSIYICPFEFNLNSDFPLVSFSPGSGLSTSGRISL